MHGIHTDLTFATHLKEAMLARRLLSKTDFSEHKAAENVVLEQTLLFDGLCQLQTCHTFPERAASGMERGLEMFLEYRASSRFALRDQSGLYHVRM